MERLTHNKLGILVITMSSLCILTGAWIKLKQPYIVIGIFYNCPLPPANTTAANSYELNRIAPDFKRNHFGVDCQ